MWWGQSPLCSCEDDAARASTLELDAIAESFDKGIADLCGRDVLLLGESEDGHSLTLAETSLDKVADFMLNRRIHQDFLLVGGGRDWDGNGVWSVVHGYILANVSEEINPFSQNGGSLSTGAAAVGAAAVSLSSEGSPSIFLYRLMKAS